MATDLGGDGRGVEPLQIIGGGEDDRHHEIEVRGVCEQRPLRETRCRRRRGAAILRVAHRQRQSESSGELAVGHGLGQRIGHRRQQVGRGHGHGLAAIRQGHDKGGGRAKDVLRNRPVRAPFGEKAPERVQRRLGAPESDPARDFLKVHLQAGVDLSPLIGGGGGRKLAKCRDSLGERLRITGLHGEPAELRPSCGNLGLSTGETALRIKRPASVAKGIERLDKLVVDVPGVRVKFGSLPKKRDGRRGACRRMRLVEIAEALRIARQGLGET